MTNVLIGLTVIRLLTNSGASTVCSDGKGGVLREQRYVVSAEVMASHPNQNGQDVPFLSAIVPWDVYAKTWTEPILPPLPLRTKPARQASVMSSSPLTDSGLILYPAWVMDPDCQCPFFRVSFLAQTNNIYSFQRSRDLTHWELRPPEIDGDAGVNAFYDVLDGAAMYRVVSRPGVLPP